MTMEYTSQQGFVDYKYAQINNQKFNFNKFYYKFKKKQYLKI